jgi:hypothetical protein
MPRKNHHAHEAGYRAGGRTNLGVMRVVYDAKERGLDTPDRPWVVICAHHEMLNTTTLKAAKEQMRVESWCGKCRAARAVFKRSFGR